MRVGALLATAALVAISCGDTPAAETTTTTTSITTTTLPPTTTSTSTTTTTVPPTTSTSTTTTSTTTTTTTVPPPPPTTTTTTATAQETHVVRVKDFAFNLPTLTISKGDRVRWRFLDAVAHTTTADGGEWGSGQLTDGETYRRTFQEPGEYGYHCAIHPSMTGTIIVEP